MPLNQTQDQTNFYEVNYLTAKKELEQLLENEPLNSSKRQCTQQIIFQIEKLKKDGKLPILDSTALLNDTKALLNHSMTPESYREKAQTVQGSSSIGMKILGSLMIALGAIVTALCIAIAATIGIKLSGEGVIGAGVLAAGIGLFSGGMRSGLSKAMNELADNAPKLN
jgi:VPS inhibitor protein E